MFRIHIGLHVKTDCGTGIVIGYEKAYKTRRYLIELTNVSGNNPFAKKGAVLAFWKHEIHPIKNNDQLCLEYPKNTE